MNAITHTQDLALPLQPFANATSRVNEWRGRCLDSFTRAEAAVTECLIALAEVEGKGQQVRLPHLVGQRLDALAQAVAAGGPFEAEGTGASLALERFRVHDSFRNMLCHGVGKVTLDPQGTWTLVLRLAALRSRRLSRDTLALTEAEAEQLQAEVGRASKGLCSRLGQVRAHVAQRSKQCAAAP